MSKRIFMTDSKVIELGRGQKRSFRRGNFYKVADDDADALIDEEKAYDEEHPPACEYCDATFEGLDAWDELRFHVSDEHPAERVETLDREQLEKELSLEGLDISNIDGTGADGRVLKEDIVTALKEHYTKAE